MTLALVLKSTICFNQDSKKLISLLYIDEMGCILPFSFFFRSKMRVDSMICIFFINYLKISTTFGVMEDGRFLCNLEYIYSICILFLIIY